jgi:hypothetical protein
MGNSKNLKPWPKGTSGNPAGRPKNDLASELARLAFESLDQKQAAKVLAKMILKNPKMLQVLADRAFGRVPQTLNLTAEINVGMMVAERLKSARERLGKSERH